MSSPFRGGQAETGQDSSSAAPPEEEAEQAYLETVAMIRAATSDRVGTGTVRRGSLSGDVDIGAEDEAKFSFQYSDGSDWLEDEVGDDEDVDMTEPDDAGGAMASGTADERAAAPPPHRSAGRGTPAVLQRANTPVMSNASKTRMMQEHQQRQAAASTSGTPRTPLPVSTPGGVGAPIASIPRQRQVQPSSEERLPSASLRTSAALARSNPSHASSHAAFRRYYNATLDFVASKRNFMSKLHTTNGLVVENQLVRLGDNDKALATMMDVDPSSSVTPGGDFPTTDRVGPSANAFVQEETKIDLNFLRALHRQCWDQADMDADMTGSSSAPNLAQKEGNLWLLLSYLRQLDLEALVWLGNDDERTEQEQSKELRIFITELANRGTDATPMQLVEATMSLDGAASVGTTPPLVLRRRRVLMKWLQSCFARTLPPGATRARPSMGPNKFNPDEGLPRTDQDEAILRDCLALMLAGRFDAALELVRGSNLAWRAASWSGGTPYGTDPQSGKSVGNPHRHLWKRVTWQYSESLAQNPASIDAEGAIAALLADHVKNAIDNRCFRSWEKGLYVTLSAILGRMEDEILHLHNNRLRTVTPPFPGTEHELKEFENLQATADIAALNERGAVFMLTSSPFEEMKCADPLTQGAADFVVGRDAVVEYMEWLLPKLEKDGDINSLRFATHLLLYLDSLSTGTAPTTFDRRVSEWKDRVLLEYLEHLHTREDLWFTLVLYSSLLPLETYMENLPRFLWLIESPEDRRVVVQQLVEFLPKKGQDIEVLKRLVRYILKEPEEPSSMAMIAGIGSSASNTPTRFDLRKMNAIHWFCTEKDALNQDYLREALLWTNALLRQFLSADKLSSAIMFVTDVLPDSVKEMALGSGPPESSDDVDGTASANTLNRAHARSEFQAFHSYLDATESYDNWFSILSSTATVPSVVDDRIDTSQLNASEAAIASKAARRELIQEKRKLSFAVVKAAERAHEDLISVLDHDGGWLFLGDEVVVGGDHEDVMERRHELHELRRKLLPQVVRMSIRLCVDTASWMNESLNDASDRLGCPEGSALALLDDAYTRAGGGSSPLLPEFWTGRALRLTEKVADESSGIQSACEAADLKGLLDELSEVTISHPTFSSRTQT